MPRSPMSRRAVLRSAGSLVVLLGVACSDPTGPDAAVEFEGTWSGATSAHALTLQVAPSTETSICVLPPSLCTPTVTETWVIEGTYQDHVAAVTQPIRTSIKRTSGPHVELFLYSRAEPQEIWSYSLRGRLTDATSLRGWVVATSTSSERPEVTRDSVAIELRRAL